MIILIGWPVDRYFRPVTSPSLPVSLSRRTPPAVGAADAEIKGPPLVGAQGYQRFLLSKLAVGRSE